MSTFKSLLQACPIDVQSGILQIGRSLVLPYRIMGGRFSTINRSTVKASLLVQRSDEWKDESLRGLYEDLYLGIDPTLPSSVQGADRRACRWWVIKNDLPSGRVPIVLSCLKGNKAGQLDEYSSESLGAEAIFVSCYTTPEPAGEVQELAYGIGLRLYETTVL